MATSKKRVHILTAVNAANVSKSGSTYTIAAACGAVDEIVMNGVYYAAAELAKGAPTLTDKPAPIGHPKNAAGQYISANSGDALLTAYAGVVCRNGRHTGGRTLADLEINAAQAKAHPKGDKVIAWAEAAVNGENPEPMHVSTGLFADMVDEAGEVGGKKYTRRATNIRYDHLALLPDGGGAGTPEQGVGMFNDGEGGLQEVETFAINTEPEDKRAAGLLRWLNRLVGNGASDLSFDQITSLLYAALPKGAWLREVFDRYVVWCDESTGKCYRQDYSVASDGSSVAFAGQAVEVTRRVEYVPVTNHREADNVKDTILAALNAAGIAVAGLTDAQLLTAYNALQAKPHTDALTAANSKLAEIEQAANAARDAELTTLATELATNSKSLTAADFKAMGLARCKELKAVAAPIVVGNTGTGKADDEFSSYDCNALIDAAGKPPVAAAH